VAEPPVRGPRQRLLPEGRVFKEPLALKGSGRGLRRPRLVERQKRRGEERFRSRDRVACGLMRGGVARRSRAGRAGVLPEDGVDVLTRDPSGWFLTNCQRGRKMSSAKFTVAQRARLSSYGAREGCRSHQQRGSECK
jgi:hypothetical protein